MSPLNSSGGSKAMDRTRRFAYLMIFASALASAQQRPAQEKNAAPRLPDGKPDLNGVLNGGPYSQDISRNLLPGEQIVLTPAADTLMKSRRPKDDPEANCLPAGVPRMAPYPWRIVQTPTLIVFLYEGNIHTYRQVFLDGRGHEKDPEPSWYGDSIGKW